MKRSCNNDAVFLCRHVSSHHRPVLGPFIITTWPRCTEADTGGKGLIIRTYFQEN